MTQWHHGIADWKARARCARAEVQYDDASSYSRLVIIVMFARMLQFTYHPNAHIHMSRLNIKIVYMVWFMSFVITSGFPCCHLQMAQWQHGVAGSQARACCARDEVQYADDSSSSRLRTIIIIFGVNQIRIRFYVMWTFILEFSRYIDVCRGGSCLDTRCWLLLFLSQSFSVRSVYIRTQSTHTPLFSCLQDNKHNNTSGYVLFTRRPGILVQSCSFFSCDLSHCMYIDSDTALFCRTSVIAPWMHDTCSGVGPLR
jgi:hypothetical protein